VSPSSAVPARPLVVSSDEGLLDDLLRLLAAAGTEPDVATGGPALRRAYREAPVVLAGADALSVGQLRPLPRRPGVVVVTARELPAPEWAAAVELGAERVAVLPEDEAWLLTRVTAAVRSPVERGRLVVVVTARELPAPEWAAAVELGAERVAVLPEDEAWLLTRVTAAVRSPVERGRLVVVGGSCGGAGASTVAAAVALAAAPGVLLVDADAWGGGIDLLLGAERDEGLRWPDLTGLRGRVAGDALLAALPEVSGVHVLAASRGTPCDVPEEAFSAVVEAARSAGGPAVVDLPRADPAAPGFPGGTVLADADLAVLVVPARVRAATAARLLVEAPGSGWSTAQLVVRPVGGGLSTDDVAEVVGRPVLAELPHDRAAVPRSERGEPPLVSARSPLGRVARRVLAELATVPASSAVGAAR
jgi:secretion/DNA translocation related CpaE-like protein